MSERKPSKRKTIKDDLTKQLVAKGISETDERFFYDLLDDYMALWDTKNKLIADIKKHGVTIKWNNGGGQEGSKKNDSVSELTRVSTQMLKLLSDLGMKASDRVKDGDG